MKKLLIIILLIGGIAVLRAAEHNIALTSYGTTAENLTNIWLTEWVAEYNFVERQNLALIMQEQALTQKFSQANAARQSSLAGADIFMTLEEVSATELRLTVFETECGFQLFQLYGSAEQPEFSQHARQRLAAALKKLATPEDFHFISMAGIRNNLHKSLAKRAKAITDNLKHSMANLDAVFLEREYVMELLCEKKLTGKWENAFTAAEILHFEINPGTAADELVIVAFFTDAAGQTSFNFQVDNDTPEALTKLFAGIAEHLASADTRQSYDRNIEAERFAKEGEFAWREGRRLDSVKCFMAAHALSPGKETFLNRQLLTEADDTAAFYPYLRINMQDLFTGFPALNDESIEYIAETWRIIRHNLAKLTPEQRADYQNFIAAHRDALYAANRANCNGKKDSSVADFCLVRTHFYANKSAYYTAHEQSWQALLKYLSTLNTAAERPDFLRRQITEILPAVYYFQENIPRKNLAQWSHSAALAVEKLNDADLRPLAMLISYNALLYSKDYTLEQAVKQFDAVLQTIYNSNFVKPADFPGFYNVEKVNRFPDLLKQTNELFAKYASAYQVAQSGTATVEELYLTMFEKSCSAPAALNPDYLAGFYNAVEKAEYVLTYETLDYYAVKKTPDAEVQKIAAYPNFSYQPMALRDSNWRIAGQGEWAVINNGKALYMGNATEQELWEITQMPEKITGMWFAGTRFMVLGERELISFDFGGGNRQTHFSASQSEYALVEQNRNKNLLMAGGCMGRTPDDAILLAEYSGDYRLCRYNLTTNELTELVQIGQPGEITNCFTAGIGDNFYIKFVRSTDSAKMPLSYRYNLTTQTLQKN